MSDARTGGCRAPPDRRVGKTTPYLTRPQTAVVRFQRSCRPGQNRTKLGLLPHVTIAFDDESIEFRVRFTFLVRRFALVLFLVQLVLVNNHTSVASDLYFSDASYGYHYPTIHSGRNETFRRRRETSSYPTLITSLQHCFHSLSSLKFPGTVKYLYSINRLVFHWFCSLQTLLCADF